MRLVILFMMLFTVSLTSMPLMSVQAAGARIDGNGAP